jgi:UDP-N-acetylglucosamine acyltransferase
MIHPTSVIYDNVIIEEDVYIGAFCIIGAPPESKKCKHKGVGVRIKKGTFIHGHVTIDSGCERVTTIGINNYIMKGVHIGHDVLTFNDVTIAPHSIIGGYVTICNNNNIGMGAIIHQRLTIPERCMIGMGSVITKKTDLVVNGVYVGSPARFLRHNNRE